MSDLVAISEELKRIKEFAKENKRVFLYGAGNIAKAVLDVLENEGIFPDGVIVSESNNESIRDIPVYEVTAVQEWIKEEDGVILSFTGAKESEIGIKFNKCKPNFLEINHMAILALDDNIRFRPVIDEAKKKFGICHPWENLTDSSNLLIVRLDMIGDFVFTTPFLRELRRNFPKSKITIVIRRQNYLLAKDCPYIDKLLLYDCQFIEGELSRQAEKRDEAEKRARDFADKHFKNESFDCVFFTRELLQGRNVLDEFYLGLYSGARIRIGRQIILSDAYEENLYRLVDGIFSFVSRHAEPMHEAEYTLQILRDLGLSVEDDSMELWLDEEVRIFAKEKLQRIENKDSIKLIALGLVASVPQRTWSPGNYVKLIEETLKIKDKNYAFVLVGGSDSENAANYILKNLDGELTKKVIDMTGMSNLLQTEALVNECDMYIGSNTGLLHIASAFKKPSITIYGELEDGNLTDGDSPFRMGAWRVQHVDLVPPAGLDGCHGVCRMHFSHCIEQIEAKDVINALNELDNQD